MTKHFPDYQQDFAPLAAQLKNLGLPGADTAQTIQDNLSEILKGDASDATSRLGCDPCSLYEHLTWARKVKKAFDNGIESLVRKINHILTALPFLPHSGIPGQLMDDTESLRQGLQEILGRSDFFEAIPELQTKLKDLEVQIEQAAKVLIAEEQKALDNEKARLQGLPEWGQLSEEDRTSLAQRMDLLTVSALPNLQGIQKLINDSYTMTQGLKTLEAEIRSRAAAAQAEDGDSDEEDAEDKWGDAQELVSVEVSVPVFVVSKKAIDDIIVQLESFKRKLGRFTKLRITWKLPEE